MEQLIQLKSFPVQTTLKILLQDKTTKKNIIWATNSYKEFGDQYSNNSQMTTIDLIGLNPILIQPRIMKALEQQQERTKSHAEVFTPSWLCNIMNNYCDEEWFGRKDVFNIQKEQTWESVRKKIVFPKGKTWKQYVDSRRLEITCGEAPYIVSRYDTATGEVINVKDRVGILDRKLRVIAENTEDEAEWLKWTIRAFQSVYGYEYQGDNLLIARINLLMTFLDYLEARWQRQAEKSELRKIANIITWNVWQMDGLTGTVPLGEPQQLNFQYSLFNLNDITDEDATKKSITCKIYDWRAGSSILYESLKEEE